MLKHVVMMKFKEPGAKRNAEAAKAKLLALMGKVESLRAIEVGLDSLNSGRAWDLLLTVQFDDINGYHAYDRHPAHEEVRAFIKSVRESSAVVDYEV